MVFVCNIMTEKNVGNSIPAVCRWSMLVGTHVSQLDSLVSQCGPCNHSSEGKNCQADTLLVRRSAGLSDKGVYDHCREGFDNFGNTMRIQMSWGYCYYVSNVIIHSDYQFRSRRSMAMGMIKD